SIIAIFDDQILTFNETEGSQPVKESSKPGHIARNRWEAPNSIGRPRFLRTRSERPCGSRAHKGDELAPPHPSPYYSITLSARTNNASGTVTPIALAVLRLITNSNLLTWSTGKSL